MKKAADRSIGRKYSPLTRDRPFLDRPRLHKLFEAAIQNAVIMVTAGAGYGKTQAVNSFLSQYDADTIWVQLSEEDNLGGRFWEHYAGAIAQVREDTGAQIAELGFPETLRHFDRYMALLYEKNQPRKKYVTVFDDFDHIHEPLLLSFFNRILTVPLFNASIILIARTEPALNRISLLSRGILAEITIDELRFSQEEICRYFQMQYISLSPEELVQIHHDTEGWALAVDIIAQDLNREGKKNYTPFFAGSFKKIEDTLFASMGKKQQLFLIKLSLIDYWPLELLEQLPEEQQYIAEIDRLNSFIRYDTFLQGYRIHHLFMDFLREKQGELSPGEIREVYRRAAEWCLKNKLKLDAAVNYERAGNYEGLLEAINTFPRIPSIRTASFLLETIDRMSSAQSFSLEEEEKESFFFLRYIARARLLISLGRFDESAEASWKAVKQFESLPPSPRRSRALSAAYNNLGTLMLFTCRSTKQYDCGLYFKQGYHYYLENPVTVWRQPSQSSLNSYLIQVGYPAGPGEIKQALEIMSPGMSYASAAMNGYLYGANTLAWAELAYYQWDLPRAEKFTRQAVHKAREKKQYEIENRGLFYLMRIYVHTGNFPEILEVQRQLEAQLEISEYLNRYTIHDVGMGRFYAHLEMTEKIAPWLRNEYEEGELNIRFHNYDFLVRAWRFFVEKDYAAVLRVLGQKEVRRDLETFVLGKLEITILEAVTRYHLEEEDEALRLLEYSWEIAAPNFLDMPFIELGEHVRLLGGLALAREDCRIPRPWLENIRNRASAYNKKLFSIREQYRQEEQEKEKMPVYLNSRERSVLAGLAQGLKREDIAEKTGLSLNTVRTVISTMYGKLGAVNRADAIRIALTMGILKN
ncbi:MAG: LuxR C-terminal-related transcriptional regulator [Treponema sp.]|jgi:LuxR family maltose regulon positive regulatory protein|nr:LuxR C-terminal-related transcriptional regulator [Treponema sp.]